MDENDQAPEPGAALSELIEVEQRIGSEVEAAQAEADRLISAARAYAEAVEHDDDGAVAESVYALRRTIDEECESTILAIEAGAATEVERYEGVDGPTLQRLARWVLSQLAGGDPAA